MSLSFLFYFTTKNEQWWNPTMWFRVNMSQRPLQPKILYEKLFFFLLIHVSPLSIGPTFPKVRILAHICQNKWNLISFDDENDKKILNKRSYTEKNLSIYS